jgi:cytochrome P450
MIDFFSDAVRRNPYPVYEELRASSPVLYVPQADLWMIFDYEGARRALSEHENFSSNLLASAGHPHPAWLIFSDPPRHTKLRALLTRAFTPRVVANLEPRIRELSQELLDRAVVRGEMDLAGDFAIPLPMMVISEMIGIPSGDWPRFRRWSEDILKLSHTIRGMEGAEAAASASAYSTVIAEMKEYLPELVARRRESPRDDLLTRLVEAEVDGERLTPEDILGFVQLLLVGGNETTTNLIDNAVLCFLENPDELARLGKTPDLLPSAIEEVLRYRSPLQWVFRGTRRDVSMSGKTIPGGKLVLVFIGSANRDRGQFRDPDRFDIARDPNPHLAFGLGIHFCLGAPLSRLEAKIALTEFLSRTKEFKLASSEPWEPRKALNVLGPARLPIRVTTRPLG